MKRRFVLLVVAAFLLAVSGSAQRGDEQRGGSPQRGAEPQRSGEPQREAAPRANRGHVPAAPQARSNPRTAPEAERAPGGRVNSTPHVNNDHWYGHDRPNDTRYRLAKPFEHGHFDKAGASFRYNVMRVDKDHHQFWLPGGFYFQVADWDWSVCSDWCWDCGDDFTIYEDPDHSGWYLLYNVHTGAYVHVQYMGT